MRPIRAARPAGAALILAALFAASPSAAFWPFTPSETVKKEKIVERSNKEFGQLIDNVQKNDKLQPEAKELTLNHIRTTQERFNARAVELKKPEYAGWEFDLLGEQVSKVIVPTIAEAVASAALMPMANQVEALADTVNNSETLNAAVTLNFFQKRSPDIGAWAKQNGLIEATSENPDAINAGPDGPRHTDQSDNPGTQLHEAGHPGGLPLDPADWTPEHIDWAIKQSEVVQLGVSIANDVAHPQPPKPEPPVVPGTGGGTGGGVVPTPAPGGGASPNPGGGSQPGGGTSGGSSGSGGGPASIGDVIRAIASPSGVSQLYASAGVSSLRSRDFRKAFDMAGRALSLDPRNRNALEVMNSAKGRIDGREAGASSWAAATGAAASLGRAQGEAGSFAGASPSAEIAAAAMSGAAKVAGDQARAGAMSALKLGDPRGALGILNKSLADYPANPALLNLRAQTYGRMGRWDDARKDAVAGLALAPGNMILLNTKALSENRSRRWREALATSDQMIAADPRSAWAFANRAHALAGLGDRNGMLSDINRAAALDPRFRQAAAAAALIQVPSDADVMFLFPGEAAKKPSAAPAAPGRGRSFGVVAGAGVVGGLLLALGLLSTVMAPLRNTVVSVFTRAKRTGPETNAAVATAQPASVAGNVGLIRGQYEISRQIGAGGMGMVYEGTDRSLGRRVAIKKMREELRVNARERDRFIIEAKTVASLHHPNIVDIYAIAEEGSDVYLVFEYVDGKTVHELVQLSGRLEPAEAIRVARAMGEALTYAHSRGVIHRDMKPSNVMLTKTGEIKVMDFGIARMAKDALTRYSMTNTVVGTPPYMAPEQEQGVVRKESDVYSLAICAYEMLTGKLPFIGIGAGMLMNKINMSYIPPSRAIAGVPEAFDDVFLKALQADPERRYRTPQELVAALSSAAGGARSQRPA